LFGLRTGHPCTQASSGKNHEYLHNCWSIQRRDAACRGDLMEECCLMLVVSHPIRKERENGRAPGISF
jgi:hypothetical protein